MKNQMTDQQNILRFSLSGRGSYGINVLKIREIVPYKKLNRLPSSKPGIAGLIELRGQNIQVIDLSHIIGQPSLAGDDTSDTSIIVTEFNRTMQGLLVKKVDKIISIDWQTVSALPRATGNSHYLSGVLKVDNDLVGLIDVEKILYELTPQPTKVALPKFDTTKIIDKKVLAVDDSRMARKLIANTLEQMGVDYIMASSGQDALDIMGEDGVKIDMVISDIEMPHMDGYALSRELRKNSQSKDCYILLHSSLSGNACQNMSDQSGANRLLTKFVENELAEAVTQALCA